MSDDFDREFMELLSSLTEEEKQSIRHYAERFVKHFGGDADELLMSKFWKLTPNSASPYKQLYVNN